MIVGFDKESIYYCGIPLTKITCPTDWIIKDANTGEIINRVTLANDYTQEYIQNGELKSDRKFILEYCGPFNLKTIL